MLEIQHLTVQSKDRIILEDVSFQLEESQSLAIVGESGSGKSTLLKVLLGLPLRDLR
ncbi:ATP-binding cassette domain-containing protein, partial [Streptococcus vestibularis]